MFKINRYLVNIALKEIQYFNDEKRVFSMGIITVGSLFYYFYSLFLLFNYFYFKISFFLILYLIVDVFFRLLFNNLDFSVIKKIIYLPIVDRIIIFHLYYKLIFSIHNFLSVLVVFTMIFLTNNIFLDIVSILLIQLLFDVYIKLGKLAFLWKKMITLFFIGIQFFLAWIIYSKFLEAANQRIFIIIIIIFLCNQLGLFFFIKNNFKRLAYE